jgi:hypothetical protein
MQRDRQMDMKELIAAFLNFANAPRNYYANKLDVCSKIYLKYFSAI